MPFILSLIYYLTFAKDEIAERQEGKKSRRLSPISFRVSFFEMKFLAIKYGSGLWIVSFQINHSSVFHNFLSLPIKKPFRLRFCLYLPINWNLTQFLFNTFYALRNCCHLNISAIWEMSLFQTRKSLRHINLHSRCVGNRIRSPKASEWNSYCAFTLLSIVQWSYWMSQKNAYLIWKNKIDILAQSKAKSV